MQLHKLHKLLKAVMGERGTLPSHQLDSRKQARKAQDAKAISRSETITDPLTDPKKVLGDAIAS